MTNAEYLDSIIAEVLADPDWQLPPELRFFLMGTPEWSLLGL